MQEPPPVGSTDPPSTHPSPGKESDGQTVRTCGFIDPESLPDHTASGPGTAPCPAQGVLAFLRWVPHSSRDRDTVAVPRIPPKRSIGNVPCSGPGESEHRCSLQPLLIWPGHSQRELQSRRHSPHASTCSHGRDHHRGTGRGQGRQGHTQHFRGMARLVGHIRGSGAKARPHCQPHAPTGSVRAPTIPSSTELLQGFLCPWHSRLLPSTVTFCQESLPPGHCSASGTALGAELSTGTAVTPQPRPHSPQHSQALQVDEAQERPVGESGQGVLSQVPASTQTFSPTWHPQSSRHRGAPGTPLTLRRFPAPCPARGPGNAALQPGLKGLCGAAEGLLRH